MNKLLACLLLSSLPAGAFASGFSSSDVGTAAADVLAMPVGAAGIGMGEAYTAMVKDPTAVYWNPAGLTGVKNAAVTVMYSADVQSVARDFASYAMRFEDSFVLALSANSLRYGDIVQTDDVGADIGTFSPRDLALAVSLAQTISADNFFDGFSFGASAKYIDSKIVSSAQTWAGDAGVMTPYYFGGMLRAGASISNLGGTLKFDQTASDLPVIGRVGLALSPLSWLTASADLGMPKANKPYMAVGGEAVIGGDKALICRAGYNTRKTSGSGFALGAGIRFWSAILDYSFQPFGDLGSAHRVSLTVNF